MPEIKLDRPLCLADDMQTVVEADDPRAAHVLGGKGSIIKHADVERLGLVVVDEMVMQGNTETVEVLPAVAEADEPEAKAIVAPPANKAIKGPKNTK